ncbi:sterol carrier protein 2 [Cladophialophora psammophila CBS 110553]|uniref:propanoyl-CoA C-acyltransferase n=1 Tax=Cladophialophora psammophila CBS 110553 TaxID=1182543 RepID=W9WSW8_9EURO|nr:sterol carrier protein 2 [Cladophialophora psammophila CBS 110553]EXJ61409.1 sterol carrier protein 2 [Cladophialophora psammophila CBS 110553]
MASDRAAFILGVGMTKFVKPQHSNDYVDMGFEAGVKALLDAHIMYDDVQQGVASYCYGDSTCGQRVFYQFGMTQIPIYNVNNNCASGSTAMVMARDFVRYGAADCVLAVGFEKMATGSLGSNFSDRTDPLDRAKSMSDKLGNSNPNAPFAAKMFGNAADEYIKKYGASPKDFAEIARVNHEHSQRNPYAQFKVEYSEEQILRSPAIYGVLTKLQCCPTSDGAAAAVVVSQSFLDARPHLKAQAVQILGQSLTTDSPSLYQNSAVSLVGYELVAHTASQALNQAKADIRDVKVVELHDCFSTNEMLVIDALGLSPRGKAHEYVRNGSITYGSDQAVVNPSGGLISKGHPLGATGLAQCAELTWQLRGWANNRLVSVPAGKLALQQNAGLGGACVVTVLRRADGQGNQRLSDAEVAQLTGLGYNPAVEARGFTLEQAASVRSRRQSEWAIGKGKGSGQAMF